MEQPRLIIEIMKEGADVVESVPSKSHPEINYTVVKNRGLWMCSCIANSFGNECSHIKMARSKIETNDKRKI